VATSADRSPPVQDPQSHLPPEIARLNEREALAVLEAYGFYLEDELQYNYNTNDLRATIHNMVRAGEATLLQIEEFADEARARADRSPPVEIAQHNPHPDPAASEPSSPAAIAVSTGTDGRVIPFPAREASIVQEPTQAPVPPPIERRYTNVSQWEFIESDQRKWKTNKYGIPYPPEHSAELKGGRSNRAGRGLASAFEFRRKAVCVICGVEVRPQVGYLSGRQARILKGESRNAKINFIRGILRRSGEEAEAKLIDLRCAACDPRPQGRRD
jgi:hypothetical protein